MPVRRDRFARQRSAMGLTQEQLAAAVGMGTDRSTVYRWEAGETTPPPRKQPRLARALGVSPTELIDLLAPGSKAHGLAESRPDERSCLGNGGDGTLHDSTIDAVPMQIPVLRRVLDSRDLPPDGQTRPLGELRPVVASVLGKRLRSNYAALATEVPALLTELYRAVSDCPTNQRRQYARLLVQVYRAADALADKYGYYDLSARIIELLRDEASRTEDELVEASGSYVRGETFFASGDLTAGRDMLERAAGRIVVSSSETAAATYGTLHMRAAVLAARAGQAVQARAHIEEAQQVAQCVNEGVHLGTVFGPTSVRIHQLSLAVELGDISAALGAAAGWQPPTTLPGERRSHFYIDLARAYHHAGRPQHALDALHTARSIAPEHVRSHQQVREIVEHMRLTQDGALQGGFDALRR